MIKSSKGTALAIPNSANSEISAQQFWDFDSRRLLSNLATRDGALRAIALEHLIRRVEDWYLGYGSPVDSYMCLRNVGNFRNTPATSSNATDKIISLLPDLQRLSTCCPFEDVRRTMTSLVASLKVSQICINLFYIMYLVRWDLYENAFVCGSRTSQNQFSLKARRSSV